MTTTALQKLTEAGEIQAALERIAELEHQLSAKPSEPCCGDFDRCQRTCIPRGEHLGERKSAARIAELEAALHLAFAKMDRARDILTDGKPRIDCNWGMLATEAIKHGLGWPMDRAALAGKPAPRLTDAEIEVALRRAYSMGQTYWQQANSEYTSQHRKADATHARFEGLISETIAKVRGTT